MTAVVTTDPDLSQLIEAPAEQRLRLPNAASRWIGLACMTAGLILGVVLASSFGIGSDIRSSGGTLFAQGALGEALSRDLSGGRSALGPSFWSKDGVFCRVFTRRGRNSGVTGIACRDAGAWRIRIVSEVRLSITEYIQQTFRPDPMQMAAAFGPDFHVWTICQKIL